MRRWSSGKWNFIFASMIPRESILACVSLVYSTSKLKMGPDSQRTSSCQMRAFNARRAAPHCRQSVAKSSSIHLCDETVQRFALPSRGWTGLQKLNEYALGQRLEVPAFLLLYSDQRGGVAVQADPRSLAFFEDAIEAVETEDSGEAAWQRSAQ